tara:strand:- start:903 stop:1085 length:183 start_codon:yes stop_codon:yes gene_type:complete
VGGFITLKPAALTPKTSDASTASNIGIFAAERLQMLEQAALNDEMLQKMSGSLSSLTSNK